MVKLTPGELSKPNSKTGQPRLEILLELVRLKVPLFMHDGTFVEVIDVDRALAEIGKFAGKAVLLRGISGDREVEFTTSDLAKSSHFGGGGGVGCGTEQTAINESAQAVYCAAAVQGAKVSDIKEGFVIESHIDDVLSLRPDWVKSSQLIADHLVAKGIINRDQIFHHGSEYIASLCKVAKRLVENEGLVWNKDKWNPADIWAVKGEPEMSWSTIHDMNESMRRMLIDRELVGISLKKVLQTPVSKVVNGDHNRPIITMDSCRMVGSRGSQDFFSSKKVLVEFSGGQAAGRTYDPIKNWSLEIDGRAAKHGKIGKGPLSSILVASGLSPLPDHKILLDNVKSAPDDFLGEFYHLYRSNHTHDRPLTESEFFSGIREMVKTTKGMDWVYSKFIGANFVDTISHNSELVGEIVLYAMSQSKHSAPFIKVQEENG